MNYPFLMQPIRIGSLTVKNRIEATPTSFMDASTEGLMPDSTIEYYRMRAKGGAGLITLGEAYVDPERGLAHPCDLRLFEPLNMPSLVKAAEAVHQYGAVCSIELLHPGQRSDVNMNRSGKAYGPSPVESIFAYDHPVYELTEEMILDIIRLFGEAAAFAKDCGIDMVMIYAAHGNLIPQFLSPLFNHRTDRWGGSIENRCRLPYMIAQEIKKRCGKDFPVEFRVSAAEHIPGGYTIDDTIALINILAEHVDLINVSNGSFGSKEAAKLTIGSSIFMPHGHNIEEAAAIRKAVSVPVSVVGGLGDLAQMEELVKNGTVDMVSMARSLIADPFLPRKAQCGSQEDVRPCIRCNYCFSHNYIPLTPYPKRLARCAVNPLFGREEMYARALERKAGPKKVCVVGGGPAGMQAALTAASLGHDVVLYEKETELGGLLRAASRPAFKEDLRAYLKYLVREVMKERRIRKKTGCEALPEDVRAEKPDLVLLAFGAQPVIPKIPGIRRENVFSVADPVMPDFPAGKNAAVIGGGLSGCEEALDLARRGLRVVLLEQKDMLLSELSLDDYLHRKDLLDELEAEQNLTVITGVSVTEIGEGEVFAEDREGRRIAVPADHVICACGFCIPYDAAEKFRSPDYELMAIGDCLRPRSLRAAVQEGFLTVLDI